MSDWVGPGASGEPGTLLTVFRGLRCRCPRCGEGRLFGRFLKVAPACSACELPFHHHRADDFPPYIVMFIVGHLVGYLVYLTETGDTVMPFWTTIILWPALALALCIGILQPVKGAVVALQYALGMHGFGGERQIPEAPAVLENALERRPS